MAKVENAPQQMALATQGVAPENMMNAATADAVNPACQAAESIEPTEGKEAQPAADARGVRRSDYRTLPAFRTAVLKFLAFRPGPRFWVCVKGYQDNRPRPLELSEIVKLMDSPETATHLAHYRDRRCGEEKRKSEKFLLPAELWNCRLAHGPQERKWRDTAHVVELTGLVLVDFDHLKEPPAAVWQRIEATALAQGARMAQISPSGDGLHVLIALPEGEADILKAQMAFARAVGLEAFCDDNCHDATRMAFHSSLTELLYLGDMSDIVPRPYHPADGAQAAPAPRKAQAPARPKASATTPTPQAPAAATPQAVPVDGDKAICRWLREQGYEDLVVPQGKRNATLFRLASDFRHQFLNPRALYDAIHRIAPGEQEFMPRTEALATIYNGMYKYNGTAITDRRAQQTLHREQAAEMRQYCTERLAELAEAAPLDVLPPTWRMMVERLRPEWQVCGLLCSLPGMGTALTGLRTTTYKAKEQSPSFMAVVVETSGGGKGDMLELNDMLLETLMKRDREMDDKLREHYEKNRLKGSNERGERKPNLIMRTVGLEGSTSKGLKAFIHDAGGLHVYASLSEVRALDAAKKNTWSNLETLLCDAFDQTENSSATANHDSDYGRPKILLNILIAGTDDKMRHMFPSAADGLASRFIFTTPLASNLSDSLFIDTKKYRGYSDKDRARIADFARQLNAVSVDEQGRPKPKTWVHFPDSVHNQIIGRMNELVAIFLGFGTPFASSVKFRSYIYGLRAALVLAGATGRLDHFTPKELKALTRFGTWVMEEHMLNIIYRYADEACNTSTSFMQPVVTMKTTPGERMFRQLPQEFTRAQVAALYKASGTTTNPTNAAGQQCLRWKREGLITEAGRGKYRKTAA